MLSSFRNTLLAAFLLLLVLALTATISVVLPRTNQSIIENARQELTVSLRVFKTLLSENETLRQEQVTFLSNDYAFKRAIATNEENTVISVLANHGERIDADMIVLFDTQGEIIVSTHPNLKNALAKNALSNQNGDPISLLMVTDQKPYQLFITPVLTPDIIAWVGMGSAVDQTLLDTFKKITNTEITLRYRQGENWFSLSTSEIEFEEDKKVETHTQLLNQENSEISVTLTTSIDEKLAPFKPLRQQMVFIAIVTLALAALAALFIARGITQPISVLSHAAIRIARGDYSGKIEIKEKNEFGQLGQALNNMRQAINDREKHISYQANHDLLTAIPNRYFLSDWIKDFLRDEQATPRFSLSIIHVFNFNQLSDLYGSEICDQLIKRVAKVIKSRLSGRDRIARLDGNQFLVFFNQVNDEQVQARCEDILDALNQPFTVGPVEITAEVRIGTVSCPEHGQRYDELMRRAGIALASAHQHKIVFSKYQRGADETHLRKINITNRLQEAIKSGNFSLLYQPQLNLHTQKISQVEALIRWHDDELGEVFPDEFIPLAERSGDIGGITQWTLQQAIEQILIWRDKNIDIGISLNLSARDVKNKEFIDHIVEQIELHDLGKADFIFEVTESAVMENPEVAIANLQRLYDDGFLIAMDDFGTGFSSLSQLKSLPITELKIDKSFILGFSDSEDDQKIVETIIAMAHHLKLKVIAEGVEDLTTLNLLRKMDCDVIQGYHLGKPMSGDDIEQWLLQAPVAPALFAGP